jgi:plastocyanin
MEVIVTLPDKGAVPFFCKFHAALGQRGELVTVPPGPGRH